MSRRIPGSARRAQPRTRSTGLGASAAVCSPRIDLAAKSVRRSPCAPQHSVVQFTPGTRCGPTHIAHAGSGRWHRFVPSFAKLTPTQPVLAACTRPGRSGPNLRLDTLAAPDSGTRPRLPTCGAPIGKTHQAPPDDDRAEAVVGDASRCPPSSRQQPGRRWGTHPRSG